MIWKTNKGAFSLFVAAAILSSTVSVHALSSGNLGTVRPLSDWTVGKVDMADRAVNVRHSQSLSYCASVNKFERGLFFVLAQNAHGDISLTVHFSQDRYSSGQVLPVALEHRSGYAFKTTAHAVDGKSVVIQLGQGQDFLEATSRGGSLKMGLPDVDMRISLAAFERALDKLTHCADGLVAPDQTRLQSVKASPVEQTVIVEEVVARPVDLTAGIEETQVSSVQNSDTRIGILTAELETLVETQAGDTVEVERGGPDTARADRIKSLEAELAKALAEREAERGKIERLQERLSKIETEKQDLQSVQDEQRRARIKSLSEAQPFVEGRPVVVIQDELMRRQEDLERQARAQAQEAEWLEKRRIAVEKQNKRGNNSDAEALDALQIAQQLEALKAENEALKQSYNKAEKTIEGLNVSNQELTQAQSVLKQQKQDTAAVEKSSEQLQVKLDQQKQHLEYLRAELGTKEKEIVDLQSKLQTVEKPQVPATQTILQTEKPTASSVEALEPVRLSNIVWDKQPGFVSSPVVVPVDAQPLQPVKTVQPQVAPTEPLRVKQLPQKQAIAAQQKQVSLRQSLDDLPTTVISSEMQGIRQPVQRLAVPEIEGVDQVRNGDDADQLSRTKALIDDLMQRYQPQAGQAESLIPQGIQAFVQEQAVSFNQGAVDSHKSQVSQQAILSVELDNILQEADVKTSSYLGHMVFDGQVYQRSWVSSALQGQFNYFEGSVLSVNSDTVNDYIRSYSGLGCQDTSIHGVDIIPLSSDVSMAEVLCEIQGKRHFVGLTFFTHHGTGIGVITHKGSESVEHDVRSVNMSLAARLLDKADAEVAEAANAISNIDLENVFTYENETGAYDIRI